MGSKIDKKNVKVEAKKNDRQIANEMKWTKNAFTYTRTGAELNVMSEETQEKLKQDEREKVAEKQRKSEPTHTHTHQSYGQLRKMQKLFNEFDLVQLSELNRCQFCVRCQQRCRMW